MADLDLDELKAKHDKAYQSNQGTRRRAADDMLFYWITQWDDALLDDSQLAYKGEFNILRKAGRQIIADLRANPVQVDFEAKAESREDGADLLDGLYLSDDRINTTRESYDNATSEAVVCGVGGWELYTEYESNKAGDKNQVIRRKPIYEANNNSFPDPNAKRLDKSDAKYWSILEPFTIEGYKDLYEELTGETTDAAPANFANPEQSYVFPWADRQNDLFYIVRFYQKTLIKDKILTLIDPLGQPIQLRESDLTEIMDELIDQGYSIESERVIKRWEVKRYIASGEKILKVEVVAGENIPVVLTYGERAFVEGQEHWEGVTRLAKDPSRFRNFVLSYMGDMVSRSPRQKDIYFPEQLSGYEFMYEENGADNNFPYLLQNRLGADGNPLPIGPVAQNSVAQIPPAMGMMIELTRQAVEDVANPGLPQDIADPDLSGKAIIALQNRLDQQSIVYQQNLKHAKRWDAEIYASMASVVYDASRAVTLTLPDGNRKRVQVMDTILDEDTGELVTLNDITNMEFSVFADIGPNFTTKREQTLEQLGTMAGAFAQSDPAMQKILMMKQLTLMDGVSFEDIRDYANKQLMLMGIKEPETDEEIAFMEQAANQPDEPDAGMVLALAEQGKADASKMREQRLAISDEQKDINDDARVQIEAFRAETDRQKVQVDAVETGVDIDLKRVKTKSAQLDNVIKLTQPFRARVNA